MPKRRVGLTISAVATRYEIHPQTLRAYEREGLLSPSRSRGNTRLYTPDDLGRLEVILNLTRELGVNLAGVEVILNMREQMERMRRDGERLLSLLRHLDLDTEALEEKFRNSLVKLPPRQLMRLHRSKGLKR